MNRSIKMQMVSLALTSLAVGCDDGAGREPGSQPPAIDPDGVTPDGDGDGDVDVDVDDPAERAKISEYIRELGQLDVPTPVPLTMLDCESSDPLCGEVVEGEQLCIYSRYTLTEQFDKFVAFAPNSATLWPGVVVEGADAREGALTPLPLALAPITFSLSLEGLGGSPVGKMEKPSLSEFRTARNVVLAQGVTGATPAYISYDMQDVKSESSLSVVLGASVKWPGGGEVSAMFDFAETGKQSRLLVDFTQAYYTVDVDTPLTPADVFAAEVDLADVEAYTAVENPPMYLQSITYGRRVIFSIESNETSEAVQAALDVALKSGLTGSLEIDVKTKQVLSNSKISALLLGGSGAAAAKAVFGVEGLGEYITSGGNYSADSPGAPIAYRLAYLDNSPTRFAFTSEYSEKVCGPL